MTMETTLSIIVLSWDGLDLTRRCISSLRSNTDVGHELIAVDNGSLPAVQHTLTELADIAVLHDRNLGFSGGMNSGLAKANGAYVAFVNNDTVLPPMWASRLVSHLVVDKKVGMVVPAVTAAGNPVTVRGTAGSEVRPLQPFTEIPSAVIAVLRTADMRQLGGWNEDYFPASAEDADLAFSVWTNDLSIIFDGRVLVDHTSKATTRQKLPNWRRIWHDNGVQFLRRWSSDVAVTRLDRCPPACFDSRRIQARAAAVQRLQEVRKQDTVPRRLTRNRVVPVVEYARGIRDRYRRRPGPSE